MRVRMPVASGFSRKNEPMIALGIESLGSIRAHVAAGYPLECCGALIGSQATAGEHTVTEAWPLANAAAGTPERRFTVAPEDYRRAEMRAAASGATLLGFYHSHPDAPARPSLEDLAHAWPNFDYVIISVLRGEPGEISCWRLREDRSGFDREDITWPTES